MDLDDFHLFEDFDPRLPAHSCPVHRILELWIGCEVLQRVERIEAGNHGDQVRIVDAAIDPRELGAAGGRRRVGVINCFNFS